uniref:Uncharacterized protein n=1 Tax=Rhizophora mucronata TaxID=61149 RepID=A0A2P2QAG5_RHIMU
MDVGGSRRLLDLPYWPHRSVVSVLIYNLIKTYGSIPNYCFLLFLWVPTTHLRG